MLADNLNALPIVGVDARCQSIPGQGHVSLDTSLYGRGVQLNENAPLMQRGESQLGNVGSATKRFMSQEKERRWNKHTAVSEVDMTPAGCKVPAGAIANSPRSLTGMHRMVPA